MADIAALTDLIAPEARALGLDLVRVKLFGGNEDLTLQVMAERPDTRQLTIDDCAALSRRISDRLDALEAQGRDPIETAYRLEVSSPGIDRPLTRPRDFADWAGHEARVNLVAALDGRKQFKAILAGLARDDQGNETILIDDPKSGRLVLDFANIASAKLVLTDALISATVPLSTEGADEFETSDSPETED